MQIYIPKTNKKLNSQNNKIFKTIFIARNTFISQYDNMLLYPLYNHFFRWQYKDDLKNVLILKYIFSNFLWKTYYMINVFPLSMQIIHFIFYSNEYITLWHLQSAQLCGRVSTKNAVMKTVFIFLVESRMVPLRLSSRPS